MYADAAPMDEGRIRQALELVKRSGALQLTQRHLHALRDELAADAAKLGIGAVSKLVQRLSVPDITC